MKNKTIVFLLVFLLVEKSWPQGLSNFFSQKEADLKYMAQQVADLQLYLVSVEKGYHIAQQGLTVIGDLKKGEFDLHAAFFASLSAVNPSLKKYSKVADIIAYQLAIVGGFKKITQAKNMNPAEIAYLNHVYAAMSSACSASLKDLIDLMTDNTYQMKDNERLRRIDVIYTDMQDKYAFTQHFSNNAQLLSLNRASELNEVTFLNNMQP